MFRSIVNSPGNPWSQSAGHFSFMCCICSSALCDVVFAHAQNDIADDGSEHDLGDGPSVAQSRLSSNAPAAGHRRSNGLPRVFRFVVVS